MVLYLIAGGLGAPVFAEGAAGWQHFTGSTSGFLLAFPIATLVVGWLGESAHKMRYATSVLLLLLGQGIVVMLGLMWFRSIVPVEHGWIDTLAGLAPAIMVKTALGSLVVVVVGRIFPQHRSMSSSTYGLRGGWPYLGSPNLNHEIPHTLGFGLACLSFCMLDSPIRFI